MKALKDLLQSAQKQAWKASTHDKSSGVFFACRGVSSDGHSYLESASKTHQALVVSKDVHLKNYSGIIFKVEDVNLALELYLQSYFQIDFESLQLIAITGTNGKTTCAHMLEHMLTQVGYQVGVMGTINHHIGDRVWETNLTTPGLISFYERLNDFKNLKADYVVFEISSHALEQERVGTPPLRAAVFTNLSQDHLDFHKDMESYFKSKLKLFTEVLAKSPIKNKFAVLNGDTPQSDKIKSEISNQNIITVSLNEVKNIKSDFNKTSFSLDHEKLELNCFGPFNLHNWLMMWRLCEELLKENPELTSYKNHKKLLESYKTTSGRMEMVHVKPRVFVDFAHTPESLSGVLKNLKALNPSRLLVLFGCGGDRDTTKRALMGQAAEEFSDGVILTSDNPRTEAPEKIIKDIKRGLVRAPLFEHPDRAKAIEWALAKLEPDDCLLIAGKGHEQTQEVDGVKYKFSDQAIVKKTLAPVPF